MRTKTFRLVSLFACLGIALTSLGQEGHPLKGTWLGDWGPNKDKRNDLVVELIWKGKALTGTINPGEDDVRLGTILFDSKAWTVHMEADRKDAQGNIIRYVIDGKIQNLGSPHRWISGTWIQGNEKGDFKITRQ